MTYYYPLCTRDFTFENIFATESISPPAFYSKRGFGIDYFYKIPNLHHEDAIILYNQPPLYDVKSANAIKFILQIDGSSLDQTKILAINEEVIGYQKTMYLNRHNFKFLFFTETEKKIACLKSESSFPTKSIKKYEENFELISNNECKRFDLLDLASVRFDSFEIDLDLSFDRLFNTFKGLIYGIASGLLGEKSKEEIQMKRGFQDITNKFAELKNKRTGNFKEQGTKYTRTFGSPPRSSSIVYEKLVEAITNSEKHFFHLFPSPNISEEDIANYLLSTKPSRLKDIGEAMRYISYRILDDELTGSSAFSQIRSKYLEATSSNEVSVFYERLKSIGENFGNKSSSIDLNEDAKDKINPDEKFKITLYQLVKIVEKKFAAKGINKEFDPQPIGFNFSKREIEIDSKFKLLEEQELNEYLMIVNSIFSAAKRIKGEAEKKQLLNIIEVIGNKTSKTGNGRQTRLYKYLNNEIDDYSVEQASSVVMKNFVAFIFNVDSLENLENYLEAKEIDKKWISYSFWCVFNGFANTSGPFLEPIFGSNNSVLQDGIDDYLNRSFSEKSNLVTISAEANISEQDSPLYGKTQDRKTNEVVTKFDEFYRKYIELKFDIPLESFLKIFKMKSKEQITSELKTLYKIPKRDGNKLVKQFTEFISSETLFD